MTKPFQKAEARLSAMHDMSLQRKEGLGEPRKRSMPPIHVHQSSQTIATKKKKVKQCHAIMPPMSTQPVM
jgi:hypothetical protein